MREAPIAVFDSGIGGLSILRALQTELPHENFIYFADSRYAPYGEKSEQWVKERTLTIARTLFDQGAKALVVACNTATAAGILALRQKFSDYPVIGIEPAIKPAAKQSKTKHIGVLATERTLASEKFKRAATEIDPTVSLVCQAATGLALAIERGEPAQVTSLLNTYLSTMGAWGSKDGELDTLVLGCTHYPFEVSQIQAWVGPDVSIVDNGFAVARHTQRVLAHFNQLNPTSHPGELFLQASEHADQLMAFYDTHIGFTHPLAHPTVQTVTPA